MPDLMINLFPEKLALFSQDNNPDARMGHPVPAGALLKELPWSGGDDYSKAFDLWDTVLATLEVIGGHPSIGLAAYVGGVWIDTGEGNLLGAAR